MVQIPYQVLTAMEGLTNIPDKGLERILLIHDDVLYILTYQNTVDKFDSKQSQETIRHILSSFRFIDSTDKDDPEVPTKMMTRMRPTNI